MTLKIKFTAVFTPACYWKSDAKYKRRKASHQMFTLNKLCTTTGFIFFIFNNVQGAETPVIAKELSV